MKIKTVKRNIQKKKTASGKLFSKTNTSFFAPQNTDPIKKTVDSAITSAGFSLPAEVQNFFEPRFGYSFDKVKIHTGVEAVRSAEELNADAYSYKDHIIFNEGKYKHGTKYGNKLLTHELAHIIQKDHSKVFRQKKQVVDKRKELEAKFSIKIEKGDKDWTEAEINILYSSLLTLSKNEGKVLRGYHFIRWASKESRGKADKDYKDPGVPECGLHEIDIKKGIFKISIYDECFADPEAVSDEEFGVDKGKFSILHEVGHAMQSGEHRNKTGLYDTAYKKYDDEIKKYNKAEPNEQKKIEKNVKKLDKAEATAKKAMEDSETRNIGEFSKLIDKKEAMTDYAKTSAKEAFAEAFAIYKANPKWLKENYPRVYEWFSKGGFLTPVKMKK